MIKIFMLLLKSIILLASKIVTNFNPLKSDSMNSLVTGCTEAYEHVYMGSVHVKDVALAHILVYENPSASGRHLCIESICHFSDFAAKVAELYPDFKIPR